MPPQPKEADRQPRPPIYDHRRENLKRLLREAGAKTQLAARLDVSQARITHLINGTRPIHEDQARQIESIMGLSPRALDHDPSLPAPPPAGEATLQDLALLEDSVRTVIRISTESNAKFVAEKTASAVRLVYAHSRTVGRVDPEFVAQLLNLMR